MSTAIVLAVCLYAEAGNSLADHAAILAVLDARADMAGTTPERLATRYCAVFRRPDRLARVMGRDLSRAHLSVQEYRAGKLRTPCRGAVHWGGPRDAPSSAMRPVRCVTPTRNLFYSVARRSAWTSYSRFSPITSHGAQPRSFSPPSAR
jgi:hypothetical protein